jgi:hypothetical protein
MVAQMIPKDLHPAIGREHTPVSHLQGHTLVVIEDGNVYHGHALLVQSQATFA